MIYTNGCSFTNGAELKFPHIEGWPAVLANMMEMPFRNDASDGSSNAKILRNTLKNVLLYKPEIAIIQWSDVARIEFYSEQKVIWQGDPENNVYQVCNYKRAKDNQFLRNYYALHSNNLVDMNKWLLQVYMLQTFFEKHGIEYYMASAFANNKLLEIFNRYETKLDFIDEINTSKFIGWPDTTMVEWAYPTEVLPLGHPSAAGHRKIAKKIYEYIGVQRRRT